MSSMTMSRSTVTTDSFVSSVRVHQFGIVVNYFQARNARRRTGGKTGRGGRGEEDEAKEKETVRALENRIKRHG